MKQLVIFVFLFIFSASQILMAEDNGYKIKLKIKGLSDTTVTLGHHWADKTFLDTTINLNSKGVGTIEGKKAFPGGLYLIIFPDNKYFDLILSDDQHFSIETDTTNLIENMKITGCIENELFYDSQKFLISKRKEIEPLHKRLEDENLSEDSTAQIKKQLEEFEKELTHEWKKIVKEHPETFYAKILTAMNGDEGTFFDNVDFSDERLLRTSLIHTTVRKCMARDLNNNRSSDIIISNSDKLLKKAKANEKVYRYVLSHLLEFYNTFYRAGINKVFTHLVDTYIRTGDAPWFDSTAVSQITKRADILGGSFEGKIAPDIKVETFEGDSVSLHDVKAKYTVLFFWKTGCGHCTDAAKKLREFTNGKDLDLEIFALFTSKSKAAWKEFINENDLKGWTNVWDKNANSNYQLYYYIVSTPVVLLLDKDKKIISNRVGDESIYGLIEQLKSQKDKFRK